MTISVVMTTYNGEKYVKEQIHSILNQTRIPEEILILDDCSIDSTIDIVESLIKDCREINCRLVKNTTNIGWRRNFMKGFHMCSGDIIFCADQDDVWDYKKLEIMEKTLIENDNIDVLACNLVPLYEKKATKIARFYIDGFGQDYITQLLYSDYELMMIRPGCTMCFRRKILNFVDLIWNEQLAHDEVIWAIGILSETLFIVNEPLIQFRRHGGNNSPSNEKRIKTRLVNIDRELSKIDALLEHREIIGISDGYADKLDASKTFLARRRSALANRNFLKGVELIQYAFPRGAYRTWAVDMLCIIKG